MERDVAQKNPVFAIIFISTHTLTWSVTNTFAVATLQQTISTHTLTWSVTGMSLAKTAEDLTFQLTRSRGA